MKDISFNELNPKNKDKETSSSGFGYKRTESQFDPIEELGLVVSKTNQKDMDELNKILFSYLGYPNTDMSNIHGLAQRLGNFDIEKEKKKDDSGK